MDERHVADDSGFDVVAHLFDERVTADVVAGRVHDSALLCRGEHRTALVGRDRQRLLAHDVDPVLDRGDRLLRMQGIRCADVEDVDVFSVEERREIVVRAPCAERLCTLGRPAAHSRELDADRLQRDCVHARDESGAYDCCAHQRDAARNICVRTSMSSRASSAGVRHGVPSTMQPWKCSSSRRNASS